MSNDTNIIRSKLYRKVLQNDFASFIKKTFLTVSPGVDYLHNWHIDMLAAYLEACRKGDINRLIINIPPRSLKSICTSVAWPAWLLGHQPSQRIIVSSYARPLSIKHSLDCRLVMQSPWYKACFPHTVLSSDQNEKTKFTTTERGHRIATSVGGSVTGEGGNFLIVDDPHNPTYVLRPKYRMAANEWFDRTFSTRLDNKKSGVILVVMQRLHTDDLTGHLAAKTGQKWESLCLPAIAERRTIIEMGDIRVTRENGDILHPQREGKTELDRALSELGSYAFAAQYQQSPVPDSGALIQPEWIQRYRDIPEDGHIFHSWDTAIKAQQHHDYSVGMIWLEADHCYYLLDICRGQWEYPELKRKLLQQAERWAPDAILIEDKASGQALLQDLKRETDLPCIGIVPTRDKVTRMATVSGMMEAGKIFLPSHAHWLADYEKELFSFPLAPHDDQVDATSQFLQWIKERSQHNRWRIRSL